jgi:hypothetical protein
MKTGCNLVDPMRRSLCSLATGWIKWLSAIAFQAETGLSALQCKRYNHG